MWSLWQVPVYVGDRLEECILKCILEENVHGIKV